jgi:hypothetical protein
MLKNSNGVFQPALTPIENKEITEILKHTEIEEINKQIENLPEKYLTEDYIPEMIMQSYLVAYPEDKIRTKEKLWSFYIEDTFFYKYCEKIKYSFWEIILKFKKCFNKTDFFYKRIISVLEELFLFDKNSVKNIKLKKKSFIVNYKKSMHDDIFKLVDNVNFFNKLKGNDNELNFKNIYFKSNIIFQKTKNIRKITFENCCFENNVLFSDLTINEVEFKNCLFEKDILLRFDNLEVKELLNFTNCIFNNKNNIFYGIKPLKTANIKFNNVELENAVFTFSSIGDDFKLKFKNPDSLFLLKIKKAKNSTIKLNKTILPPNFSMEKSSFENCELDFEEVKFLEGTQTICFNKIELKKSSLNMEKAIINNNMFFNNAVCEESKKISFYKAKLGGDNASFISFNYSNFKNISFSNTNFLSNTSFKEVIFNISSFNSSLWGYEGIEFKTIELMDCNGEQIKGNMTRNKPVKKEPIYIDFSDSTFNNDISFDNSKFNCNVKNKGYHMNFKGIICKENFSMKRIEINKKEKANREKIRLNFNQSIFNKFNITKVINPENIQEINCSEVNFKKVPLLENKGFNGILNLKNSDIPIMDIENLVKNINLKEMNKSEVMKIKLLAKDSGDIDNELYLNAIELSKREGILNKIISYIYRFISNSGQSIKYPISYLITWDMFFMDYYYNELKNNTIDNIIQFQDVISFTLLNNIPLVAILRNPNKDYFKRFYPSEQCDTIEIDKLTELPRMCCGFINEGLLAIPASHSALIFVHLVISFGLVFLIGLGIRNRFRLK